MNEQGSIAPQVLVLLLFIAALLWAAVPYVSTAMLQCSGAINNYATQKKLETQVQKVIDNLEADRTPDADWQGDIVQEYVKSQKQAITISLTDISSKINPNYIRKNMLDQTRLRNLLRPNTNVALLQQYRFDNGPMTNLAQYNQFFRKDAADYLTCVGWANVNTTDEFMLQKMYQNMSGSATDAEEFHKKIQNALENQLLFDEEEMFIYFGEYAYKIWPVINATPWFNVNFVDPFILRAVIEYPEYSIADPQEKTNRLLELREEKELSSLDIAAVLGIGTNHALMHYLGVTTAFWKISAQLNNITYNVIVARIPENTHSYIWRGVVAGHRYVIVERSYQP
jgi:hypothetical protein